MQKITLMIASRLEDVSLVGGAVRGLCEYATFPPPDGFQIELAVVEAVNNVIFHAYQNQPEHQVTLTWILANQCLRIEIVDQGRAMMALPARDMPEDLRENGRGWPIMLAFMDQVEYHSDNGVNTLTLIKQLPNNLASG